MSYYITVMQSPRYHQMTLEDLLYSEESANFEVSSSRSNTRTYKVDSVNEKFKKKANPEYLIRLLNEFNVKYDSLRSMPREMLYRSFHIPKRSGGLRQIDAPIPELMSCLRELKGIFETKFNALYHTSAFAYIKDRNTIECMKRHQRNESKWYAHYDLSNFFGSTTIDFVINMLSMIFPFSEVMKYYNGEEELRKALDLAFLNGGLPQGTPISPMLTNLIMIPIDYELSNNINDSCGQRFVYTRYSDDFQISSKYTFDVKNVEKFISDTLNEFNAPFNVNSKKTRYGSSSGRNWNLGLMVNKDNEITVGYRKKKLFKAMLSSFVLDSVNGKRWPLCDVQHLEGLRNYYRSVEGDGIDDIVKRIGDKYSVDIVSMIKKQLKPPVFDEDETSIA